MRVSTSQIYNLAAVSMTKAQAAVNKTSEQMNTGKRALSPADDPVAATTILRSNQELARAEQCAINISVAENSLHHEELALDAIAHLLTRVEDLAVRAGNTGVITSED